LKPLARSSVHSSQKGSWQKRKTSKRRKVLRDRGYDDGLLANVDFIDAALCAATTEEFRTAHTIQFGSRDEGFIVAPAFDAVQ